MGTTRGNCDPTRAHCTLPSEVRSTNVLIIREQLICTGVPRDFNGIKLVHLTGEGNLAAQIPERTGGQHLVSRFLGHVESTRELVHGRCIRSLWEKYLSGGRREYVGRLLSISYIGFLDELDMEFTALVLSSTTWRRDYTSHWIVYIHRYTRI